MLLSMCKFNEFRETLGMPSSSSFSIVSGLFSHWRPHLRAEYKSFSEWNANEEIAAAASKLYDGKIDDLELYPGLHAEGHKDDGLIMPPDYKYDSFRVHTMRIALLFDAIALVSITSLILATKTVLLMSLFRFVVTAFSPTLTSVSRCRILCTCNLWRSSYITLRNKPHQMGLWPSEERPDQQGLRWPQYVVPITHGAMMSEICLLLSI